MKKICLLFAFGAFILSSSANAENKDSKGDVVVNSVSVNDNDDPAPPPPPPVTYRKWSRDMSIPVTYPDNAITLPTVIYTLPAQTVCFQATPVSPLSGGYNYGHYYTTSTSYTTSDLLIVWGGCPNGGN